MEAGGVVILHFDPAEGAVTVAEAAKIARVAESTVHMWVTRGYQDAHGRRQKVPEYPFRGVRHVVPVDVLIAKAAVAVAAARAAELRIGSPRSGLRDLAELTPGGYRLPFDLENDLISVNVAAELADVTPAVVRQWKHRGHLVSPSADADGRPLFRPIDVLRAEAVTRTRARRRLRRAA